MRRLFLLLALLVGAFASSHSLAQADGISYSPTACGSATAGFVGGTHTPAVIVRTDCSNSAGGVEFYKVRPFHTVSVDVLVAGETEDCDGYFLCGSSPCLTGSQNHHFFYNSCNAQQTAIDGGFRITWNFADNSFPGNPINGCQLNSLFFGVFEDDEIFTAQARFQNFLFDGQPAGARFIPTNHDICAFGPFTCTPDL